MFAARTRGSFQVEIAVRWSCSGRSLLPDVIWCYENKIVGGKMVQAVRPFELPVVEFRNPSGRDGGMV
jgi:hypothetical protein